MFLKNGIVSIVSALILLAVSASAADWKPVDPSELAQAKPKVDPNADAEAIFWDVRIEDRLQGVDLSFSMNHYIRLKIFTERGKEQFATVEIPRIGRRSISEVAGRTIKRDGTIIDVKKDSIFDRELVKTKGFKVSGKTFALPNVEVGDIIEYRYRETRDNETASHMRLYFQREIPMWSVSYHLKPLEIPGLPYGMRSMAFQVNHPPFQREPNGFFSTTLNNVPAFREEPNRPPEDQLRAWMLIYYEEDKKVDPAKFWKETGKQDFARLKPYLKVDDSVKRTAAEITSGVNQDELKLQALDAFCRGKIRNINGRLSRLTNEERKAFKENHTPSDTLKQKAGTGTDVDLLFAGLAAAAGFDARMARVADRGDTFFSPQRPTTYFIGNFSVAVKVGDGWRFFDPSTSFLEPGMLRWQEEGVSALISDPKEGFFVTTHYLQPSGSTRGRRARFKLLEDGTIEGDVSYTYTGHVARDQKIHYEEMTPAQQEEDWKQSLLTRLNTAEMSNFTIKDVTDPLKPLVVQHKVNVPGYATRTGKRILLQPAFFQRNIAPRFTEAARKWDLYFNYAWEEEDDVTFELPEGWELDQPVAPGSSSLGNAGSYKVELRRAADGRTLTYHRHFEMGRDMNLLLPAAEYLKVKKVFDFVQEQDNFAVTLKQALSAR